MVLIFHFDANLEIYFSCYLENKYFKTLFKIEVKAIKQLKMFVYFDQ